MQLRAIDWRLILYLTLSAIAMLVIWWAITAAVASPTGFGFDTRAYWGYPRDPLYAGPGIASGLGFYRYSPVFVPLMTAWTAIPWVVFVGMWLIGSALLYVWLAGPWFLPLLALPLFAIEILVGNIHLLLATAIVLGFRWPAAWSFVVLTKVTPGVGLLWFAVRREWRALGIALGVTAVLVALSAAIAPGMWIDWVRSLTVTAEPGNSNSVNVPLSVRLVAAAVIVIWGARTDRRWTVPVAATLGLPVLWMSGGAAMLLAILALHRGLPESLTTSLDWMRRRRPASSTPAPTTVAVARI